MKVCKYVRCLFLVSIASFSVTLLTVSLGLTATTANSTSATTVIDKTTDKDKQSRRVLPVDQLQVRLSQHLANDTNVPVVRHLVADNSSVLIQSERQRQLESVCSRLPLKQWTLADVKQSSDTLFVDDSLRLIYCLVPKVACTTWSRVLLVAAGKVDQTNPNDIPQHDVNIIRYKGKKLTPLSWYAAPEIGYRLKHYFKFMFVRHPIDRLVSAYRDRLLEGEHKSAQRQIWSEILPRILSGKRLAERKRSRKGVTFPEFIQYIVNASGQPPELFNQHWRPQHHLCHPCHIRYDFIGHFETMQQDARVVLQTLDVSDRVQFPLEDPDNRHQYQTSLLKEKFFRWVPQIHVDELKMRIYETDFELFGYER